MRERRRRRKRKQRKEKGTIEPEVQMFKGNGVDICIIKLYHGDVIPSDHYI